MELTLNINLIQKVTRCLITVVFLLLIASLVGQVGKYVFGFRSMYGFISYFYVNEEGNVPTYYSSIALLFASGLLTGIAILQTRNGGTYRRHWWFLAVLFAGMSMDEIVRIHEHPIDRLRSLLDAGGVFYYTWVIPGMIFVAIFVAAYAKFLLHLPVKTRNLFILAGATFVGGAIGVEMLGGYYADMHGEANLLYSMISTAEEMLEMLGVIIFIHANLDYLQTYIQTIQFKPAQLELQ